MKMMMGIMDILGRHLVEPQVEQKRKIQLQERELRSNIDQFWINTSDIAPDIMQFVDNVLADGDVELATQIQSQLRRALVRIGPKIKHASSPKEEPEQEE